MARANILTHGSRGFGLELIQNAGANKKKSASQAIQCEPERASPFRVELPKTGSERNAQINKPEVRRAVWYRAADDTALCMVEIIAGLQAECMCQKSWKKAHKPE